jgi:hypothetical protein
VRDLFPKDGKIRHFRELANYVYHIRSFAPESENGRLAKELLIVVTMILNASSVLYKSDNNNGWRG